ncbi:MAG: hypothetical protein AAF430_17580 [Myxococcota bacterium]
MSRSWISWILVGALLLVVLFFASACVYSWWVNPGVERELREDPDGDRAQKVMLLTLPSGKTIPVNYLREGDFVYAGADFPWWRSIPPEGGPGTVFIRGEELTGTVRAVTDDPERRADVFSRLRPDAVSWAGTLVVVELDEAGADATE